MTDGGLLAMRDAALCAVQKLLTDVISGQVSIDQAFELFQKASVAITSSSAAESSSANDQERLKELYPSTILDFVWLFGKITMHAIGLKVLMGRIDLQLGQLQEGPTKEEQRNRLIWMTGRLIVWI